MRGQGAGAGGRGCGRRQTAGLGRVAAAGLSRSHNRRLSLCLTAAPEVS